MFIAGYVVSATAHLVPSGSRAPWRRLGGILLQKLQTERARTLPPGRFARDPRRLQLLQHSGRLIRHGQLGRELFRCDERLALISLRASRSRSAMIALSAIRCGKVESHFPCPHLPGHIGSQRGLLGFEHRDGVPYFATARLHARHRRVASRVPGPLPFARQTIREHSRRAVPGRADAPTASPTTAIPPRLGAIEPRPTDAGAAEASADMLAESAS